MGGTMGAAIILESGSPCNILILMALRILTTEAGNKVTGIIIY